MWVFLFSPHEHTCLHDWNLSKFCSGDARWAMNKHASPSEDNSSFYFASLHSIDRLAVHHWQAISQCRQCNRRQLLLDGKSEWVCSFISLSLPLPSHGSSHLSWWRKFYSVLLLQTCWRKQNTLPNLLISTHSQLPPAISSFERETNSEIVTSLLDNGHHCLNLLGYQEVRAHALLKAQQCLAPIAFPLWWQRVNPFNDLFGEPPLEQCTALQSRRDEIWSSDPYSSSLIPYRWLSFDGFRDDWLWSSLRLDSVVGAFCSQLALCGCGLLRLTCVDITSLAGCPFWATCWGSGIGRGWDELPGLADLPRFSFLWDNEAFVLRVTIQLVTSGSMCWRFTW